MSVHLLDARFGQCRTPLWGDRTKPAVDEMLVCGEPTMPGRSYCAACRLVLTRRTAPETTTERRVRALIEACGIALEWARM